MFESKLERCLLDGEFNELVLLREMAEEILLIRKEMTRMADATVTGAQALIDLTTAITAEVALQQQSSALQAQLIADLQAELALPSTAADPVKIESLAGQVAAANAAQQTSLSAMQAAITAFQTATEPPLPPPPSTAPTPTPTPTTSVTEAPATPAPETVVLATTATSFGTSPSPAVEGTAVEFTGTVVQVVPEGATKGIPTGRVGISDPTGTIVGSTELDASGGWSISQMLPAGSYSVSADYSGDAENAQSTGSSSLVVEAAPAPATPATPAA